VRNHFLPWYESMQRDWRKNHLVIIAEEGFEGKGMFYKQLIHADHLLRQLSTAVDLSFVSETVSVMPGINATQWPPLSAEL